MYTALDRRAYLGALVILNYVVNVQTQAALWSDDKIISSQNYPWDGNQYYFSYKTNLGSSQSETGKLRTSPAGNPYIEIHGQYITPTSDGLKKIFYEADNRGFNIVKSEMIQSLQLKNRGPDIDAIYFPSDETPIEELTITGIQEPEMASVDNDLANKVGSLPAGVVASLLG